MNTLYDTIVAIATPPLKSALGILRISGPRSFDIVSNFFSKNLIDIKEKTIHIGNITHEGELVDQVVLLQFVSPKSFTGENLIEIIFHGSPLIGQQLLSICIQYGARQAEPGEFTSRAFLNEKLDLIQAEAIHDLIDATTYEAKRLSTYSLSGKTSEKLTPLRKKIADLLALIEVNIDYPEYEDIEQVSREKVLLDTQDIINFTNQLIVEGEKGRLIKEGIKVAIIGQPNVGKSSLLNALIDEEKAIVTEIAGTTRDVVEAELNLGGVVLKILDTAGLRKSDDIVESIGIQKSLKAIEKADLILHVIDATTMDETIEGVTLDRIQKPVLRVFNKVDLIKNRLEKGIYISAKDQNIQPLKDAIIQSLALQPSDYTTPSFYNTRQLSLLRSIREHILHAHQDADMFMTMDIVSSSLQLAYQEIVILLGLEGKVDLGTEIFSRFCVGK